MSPLHCNTVQDALWERVASAGPAPLSPALGEHLAACDACRTESAAVRELLEVTRGMSDPEPPADVWDGFEEELVRRIDGADPRSIAGAFGSRARRVAGIAAVLAVGFGLGALSLRLAEPDVSPRVDAAERAALLADIEARLANDARLESYVSEVEDLLVAYRASEHGDRVATFRQSLPATMVAGPGLPSEADRVRLERQRALREQLRTIVLGMLASEIEAESQGFDYIDRRIAAIAGGQLLYFVR
ncbi:MAG TPA: hypothetical protein VM778_06665 [Gemmatimonadota bacterium]|nr:hypothetical protein [Gemmatimonadota bacterium]